MGCADLLGAGIGSATAKAQQKAELIRMKKGKTNEQQRCIDFFLVEEKGGCLSPKSTSYSIQEYQSLVSQKCASLNLYNRAIEKIGLDESQIKEIDPIVLTSFVFDKDCYVKIEDGIVVSSQYSVSWIFFSREQIFTYKYILDMTSDNSWEYTKDYFYTDVTSITTTREVKERIDVSLAGGCLSKNKEAVTKSNYVIDKLEIIVPGAKDSFSMRNSATMEKSVQAAKAMIREKKYEK